MLQEHRINIWRDIWVFSSSMRDSERAPPKVAAKMIANGDDIFETQEQTIKGEDQALRVDCMDLAIVVIRSVSGCIFRLEYFKTKLVIDSERTRTGLYTFHYMPQACSIIVP